MNPENTDLHWKQFEKLGTKSQPSSKIVTLYFLIKTVRILEAISGSFPTSNYTLAQGGKALHLENTFVLALYFQPADKADMNDHSTYIIQGSQGFCQHKSQVFWFRKYGQYGQTLTSTKKKKHHLTTAQNAGRK